MGGLCNHLSFLLSVSLLLLSTHSRIHATQLLQGPHSAFAETGAPTTPRYPIKVTAPLNVDPSLRGAATDERLEWAKTFKYLGGPIISWPLNVVNIFYGSWDAEDDKCAPKILGDLVKSISTPTKSTSGAPTVNDWWKTVGKYTGKNSKGETVKVTSTLKLTNTWFLPEVPSYDDVLSGQEIEGLVAKAAKQFGGVSSFKNTTVYNLFLPKGVKENGFDSCAYHAKSTYYSGMYYCLFVHPRTSGIGGCGSLAGSWLQWFPDGSYDMRALVDYNTAGMVSPTGCLIADTLADSVIHELSEHVTDPMYSYSPAWRCTSKDEAGNQANCENADICTVAYISNPRNQGPPNTKNSWPAESCEAISFKKAMFSKTTHAYYNLEGINGLVFYTSPQLDSITKKCTMSGA